MPKKNAPKETLNTRVTRLEEAMIRLTNAMVHVAEIQAQQQTDIAKLHQETAERDAKLHQEMAERDRKTDARIQALVSAIGELIRQRQSG